MNDILKELGEVWQIEIIKSRQRARERDILEGDRNTAYFQAVANQRRRKHMIHVLEGEDGPVTDNDGMRNIAVEYYKNLFRWEPRPDINLKEDFFSEEAKITVEENARLEARFTEEEIKTGVFSSYSDGAPGPDGLPFMFYQCFWDLVKDDLIRMFDAWFDGDLDLFRLDFAMVTLIPKENEARTMNKFRPISLLNCCFKIFTKVLTNRLALIIGRLISDMQSAFVWGRYILESVVTAHEIVHAVHSSGRQGLIFKIDYEKAYDKVNLEFLFELLALRGFGKKWIDWIRSVTQWSRK